MTDTPNRPPLWRKIDDAWWSLVDAVGLHAAPPESDQAACVIRAVAKWIKECQLEDYGCVLADVRDVIDWLTAEADRAERGEVEP